MHTLSVLSEFRHFNQHVDKTISKFKNVTLRLKFGWKSPRRRPATSATRAIGAQWQTETTKSMTSPKVVIDKEVIT